MIIHPTNYALNKTIERLTTKLPTTYAINKAKKICKEEAHYICQLCGISKSFGIQIDAHHYNPVQFYPELAATIKNLVALCRHCHFLFGHFCNWRHWNCDLRTGIPAYRRLYAGDKSLYLRKGIA